MLWGADEIHSPRFWYEQGGFWGRRTGPDGDEGVWHGVPKPDPYWKTSVIGEEVGTQTDDQVCGVTYMGQEESKGTQTDEEIGGVRINDQDPAMQAGDDDGRVKIRGHDQATQTDEETGGIKLMGEEP